jgi:hypothetical protein
MSDTCHTKASVIVIVIEMATNVGVWLPNPTVKDFPLLPEAVRENQVSRYYQGMRLVQV